MTPDEARPLPPILANAESVDPTPEEEAAFAEGMANIAAGRFIRCESDEEFEALLEGLTARPQAG